METEKVIDKVIAFCQDQWLVDVIVIFQAGYEKMHWYVLPEGFRYLLNQNISRHRDIPDGCIALVRIGYPNQRAILRNAITQAKRNAGLLHKTA